MAKSGIKKVLGAVAEVFSDSSGQQRPVADHSAAAMAALRALFVSGSAWEDLRLAGDESFGRLPKELAQAVLDVLSGKSTKLVIYDVKHPEKTLTLDKKALLDPDFARRVSDGTAMAEPKMPSAYQRMMNTLFGSYQAEMDKYQREKTLYDAKMMMAKGRELGREELPLPEEMTGVIGKINSEKTEKIIEKDKARQAEKERIQAQKEEEAQREEEEAQQREAQQREEEEENLSPAERRRREAYATLNRDDAGRREVVDAVAILLTCHAIRGKSAVENNEELFDKAVGGIKKQPAFAKMTENPDKLRSGLQGVPPQKMQSDLVSQFVRMARAIKTQSAAAPVHQEHSAAKPAPAKEPLQRKAPARVPQLVLTMERRTDNDDKKK